MKRIICGHVIDALRTLPDNCVHTCVTSPPYFQLRRYCDLMVLRPDLTQEERDFVMEELRKAGVV